MAIMRTRNFPVFVLAAVTILLCDGAAAAETRYVDVSNFGELSSALRYAQNGDVIVLQNDIDLGGDVNFRNSAVFTVDGNGYAVRGGGTYGLYGFDSPFGSMTNITIENAETTDGAAAFFVGSTQPDANGDALSNSTFRGNTSSLYAGAFGVATGVLHGNVRNNLFENNRTRGSGYGGAFGIGLGGMQGSFINNTFWNNNSATYAGAINIRATGNNAMTGNFENNLFQLNIATSYAGAVALAGNLNGSIIDTTFDQNRALYGSGGAFYISSGSINGAVRGSTFSSNTASQSGGGIFLNNGGITGGISGSTFTGNTAIGGTGGAIHMVGNLGGGITNGSMFDGNRANGNGGAVFLGGALGGGISGSTFQNNSSTATNGGALYVVGAFSGGIINSTFANNTATAAGMSGGAILFSSAFSGAFTGSSFISNQASGNGGAIMIQNPVNGGIVGGTFTGNRSLAGSGGAIYILGNLRNGMSDAVFDGNTAENNGGAVYVSGSLTGDVVRVTFRDNATNGGFGGAYWIDGAHNGSIRNSLFARNEAQGDGGALYFDNGLPSGQGVYSTTFNGNISRSGNGGALYVGGGSLAVSGSTFAGNRAAMGGAVYSNGAGLTFTDTDFLDNRASTDGAAIHAAGGGIALNVSAGREMTFSGNVVGSTANSIFMEGTSGTLSVTTGAGAVLNMHDPFRLQPTGILSVVKEGAGIWKLAGNNVAVTATAQMKVTGGILELSRENVASSRAANGSLSLDGSGSNFTLSRGATLRADGVNTLNVNGSVTLADGSKIDKGTGDLDGNAALTINSITSLQGALSVEAASGTLTLSAALGDGGSVVKTGAGRVLLDQASTYSGGTSIRAGTLAVSNVNATGNDGSAVDIDSGANLELAFAANSSYNAAITGAGNLVKNEASNVTLTNRSAHTGTTTVNDGILTLQQSNSLAASSSVHLNGTAGIAASTDQRFARLEAESGTSVTLTNNDLTVGSGYADGTIAGVSNIAGVNNLIKDTAGTFRLGGHLTLAGRLDVRDGRLAVEVGNDPSPAGMPGTGTATITADSATFSNRSVLDIDAYHGDGATERNQQVIIRTVSEDIAAVPNYTIAGQQPQNVDFLSLQLRIDDSNRKELYVDSWLRWYDPRPNEAHGTFTLTGDGSFTLGAALNDEAPEAATDWDGKSLTKKGSGRLILRGLSGYTGDTTIEAGTLTLTNNLSTGANNAGRRVMNSGLLQFDFGLAASDVYNLDITGTGDLIKTANGRLALSGNNTYSGRTLIDDGIIAITNYNALGVNSAATSVAMNSGATLELAMATDGNFNKAIGGAGGVRMSGTGTATLTAANSYSGGTVVEDGGGLVAANNRALGSGGIRLENGSSLDLDFNGVFANDMLRGTAGVGLADVDGTLNTRGNIQFSGDHTDYDGLVNVLSDRLTLGTVSRTAFSSGADYDVHNGATLAGNGTIGRQDITEPGLRVRTGGTVSPGNSIGRIRVNGDVVMESGSFYEVEVDWSNSNMSDRITASGSADLQDGADGRPTVVYFGGIGGAAATTGNRWLILSASVLNGTFADVVTRSRYITPSLEYDAANAYLVLRRNGVGFVEDGMTVNQRSVGNALETLNPASDLYAQVTALGGTDDIGYAFDLLSGEMHASLVGALGNYNRSIASALRRRIIENPDCGYPLWASVDGYYALTESSKPANTARARYTSYGVSVGGEMRPGNRAILGAAFRYGDGRLKLDGRHSRADIDSFSFSLYGGWDAWQTTDATVKLMAGAGYGMHRTDSKRSITAPLAPQTLNDKYTNHSYQLFAEALYQYRMSERWTLEPYAALEWDMLRTGSIGESGGSAALTADRDSHHTVMSTLGARVEFRPAQKMTVGVDAGWQHIYGKRNPASHFRYAAGSDEFRIQGAPYARNIARASVYATYAIRECFTIQVGYDGVFGNRYASHGGEIKMQLGF